jgi:hypothetical protein
MASIYKSVNAATGIAINPTQAAQASAFFSSEYGSSQPSREVQTQYGPKLFDITMGRVGANYVDETPVVQGGSPIVPRINANFQMSREQATRPVYELKVHNPVDVPYDFQDVYVNAGTKYLNSTRDHMYMVPQRNFSEGSVDPISTCGNGNTSSPQVLSASNSSVVQVSNIPQSAYYNENYLRTNSTLVGNYAANPSRMSFENAYKTKVAPVDTGSNLAMSIFSSPLSSLTPASFSRSNISIP